MKKALFFLSLVAVMGISNAQVKFIYSNDTINGDTVTAMIDPLADEITFAVDIANLSSVDVALTIVADSTSPYINISGMCAGSCFTGRSINFTLPGNTVYTDFHANLEVAPGTPNGTSAVIAFCDPFINMPNVNFWVKFVVQSSSVDLAEQASLQLYPNPAKDFVTVACIGANLSSNSKVQIVNALGAVVKEEAMASEQSRLNVKGMPAGVYACRIVDGYNTVAVKKMIVK